MCKLFQENRENLMDLIYELNEFNEVELNSKFENYGLIGNSLNIREFLLDLCNVGVLKNNGSKYKLVSEDDQIVNQLFILEVV